MAGTRPNYPVALNEAIVAAARDGYGPCEIMRRIRSGALDGLDGPVPIKDSTFWDRWKKVKRERGDPSALVAPGRESEELGAVGRDMIAMVRRRFAQLREKEREHGLDAEDDKTLERLAKVKGTLELQLAKPASPQRGPQASRATDRAPMIHRAIALRAESDAAESDAKGNGATHAHAREDTGEAPS